MAMAYIWTFMVIVSIAAGMATGRIDEVSAAALEGVRAAVELCLSLAGIICLWTGVMEVMSRCGLAQKLSKLLHPALKRLFPGCADNSEAMQAISANVSANLLGLGNAATPYGVKAAGILSHLSRGRTSNELCMLVVLNSASLQLIPATVAGIRSAAGAEAPFDILPAVWMTTACAALVGIISAKFFAKMGEGGG